MVFCNVKTDGIVKLVIEVTILILIDGFLQYKIGDCMKVEIIGHNPYFNRWFSAISLNKA